MDGTLSAGEAHVPKRERNYPVPSVLQLSHVGVPRGAVVIHKACAALVVGWPPLAPTLLDKLGRWRNAMRPTTRDGTPGWMSLLAEHGNRWRHKKLVPGDDADLRVGQPSGPAGFKRL